MRASKTAGAIVALAIAAPLATTQYTVRPGDTLTAIAAANGTSVTAIVAANDIADPNRIMAGQVLHIGGSTAPTASAAPVPSQGVHTVARGENLSGIARRYGTTVKAIAGANGLTDPNRVVAGTRLSIPGAAPVPVTVTVHEVAPGETLSAIAGRYGVTTAAIAHHNGIANPHLVRAGQRLEIPSSGGAATAGRGPFPPRLAARADRLALVPLFDRWAAEYGVRHDLLKAMTFLESGWQNHVVSSTGAMGIGQLMPATVEFVSHQLIGTALDPAVPEQNIRMSARFLRYLLDQHRGDEALALASYYQGLRAVRERGIYPQTHVYVAGVLAFRDRHSWR